MMAREKMQMARDALVALVDYHTGVDQVSAINDGRQAIAALDAEIAKPEPEPVAYAAQNVRNRKWGYIWHEIDDVKGWISLQNLCRASGTYHGPVPLYLAPPSESAAVALLKKMRDDYATFPAVLKDKIDAVLAGQEQESVPEGWELAPPYRGYAERYAVPPSQALSLDLLERLSKTLTRLGYATPEGGMEHFNADLANQLYSLCRAVDSLFDREQPPAPGEAAITYMTGYSDGKEWAQADILYTVEPMTAVGVDAALARLSEIEKQEPIYQYQRADGGWIDQTKNGYDYNVRYGAATVRILFAAAGTSPVEPNFCESCAMGLSTCDCVTPRPVFVNQLPSAQPSESAGHWHSLYIKKCQELHDEKARLGAEIETLELAAIDDAERYAVPPSQAQPPAPGEAAREYMTGYSDAKEWAKPSQALELSDDEIDALLPTITLKGLDPKQQVWLTKKDAIAFARAIIAAIKQGGQHD